jgi:hypothetical protein
MVTNVEGMVIVVNPQELKAESPIVVSAEALANVAGLILEVDWLLMIPKCTYLSAPHD